MTTDKTSRESMEKAKDILFKNRGIINFEFVPNKDFMEDIAFALDAERRRTIEECARVAAESIRQLAEREKPHERI